MLMISMLRAGSARPAWGWQHMKVVPSHASWQSTTVSETSKTNTVPVYHLVREKMFNFWLLWCAFKKRHQYKFFNTSEDSCHFITHILLLSNREWVKSARFQITVLVHFGLVWFWLVMVLLIVWSRSLLLCPFHKKLRIWWKKSFGFRQTDNPRFSCIMYCFSYQQLTSKNLEVSEFSTLRKSTKRKSLVIRTWDFP